MKTIAYLLGIAILPVLAIAKEKKEEAALPVAALSDVRWGELVSGTAFKDEDLAGKVVVVEEWGVNCGLCIASLPNMAKMAKSGEKKGLVVVGLECQQSAKEDILKILKTARVEYPVMAGGSAPKSTGGLPYACVFDVTGKLVFNGSPRDEEFERAVKKALRDVKAKA